MTDQQKRRILGTMSHLTDTPRAAAHRPSTAAVARATGRSWTEWLHMLDAHRADELTHQQIARLALSHMPTNMPNAAWWAQGTAIAYEQVKGLRVPDEADTGDVEVTVSRTVFGNRAAVFDAWRRLAEAQAQYNGVLTADHPHISCTDKWHYWRVKLVDGTRAALSVSAQKGGTSQASLHHTKLESDQDREQWASYWQGLLARL